VREVQNTLIEKLRGVSASRTSSNWGATHLRYYKEDRPFEIEKKGSSSIEQPKDHSNLKGITTLHSSGNSARQQSSSRNSSRI